MLPQQTVHQNKLVKLCSDEQNDTQNDVNMSPLQDKSQEHEQQNESSISIDQDLLQELDDDEDLRNQLEHGIQSKQQPPSKQLNQDGQNTKSQENDNSRGMEDLQMDFSEEQNKQVNSPINNNNDVEDFEDMNESSPEKQEWSEHEDEDDDDEDDDFDDYGGIFCKPKAFEIKQGLQQLKEQSNLVMSNLEPYQKPLSITNGDATVDDFLRIKFQQLYSKPNQQIDDDTDSASICIVEDSDQNEEQNLSQNQEQDQPQKCQNQQQNSSQNDQCNHQEIAGSGNVEVGFVGSSKVYLELQKLQQEFDDEKDAGKNVDEQFQQKSCEQEQFLDCENQGGGNKTVQNVETVEKLPGSRRRNKFSRSEKNQLEDDTELMEFLNELDSDAEVKDGDEIETGQIGDDENLEATKNITQNTNEKSKQKSGSDKNNDNGDDQNGILDEGTEQNKNRADSLIDSDDEDDYQFQQVGRDDQGDENEEKVDDDGDGDDDDDEVQEVRGKVEGFFEEEAELSDEEGEMSEDELEEYLAAIEGQENGLDGFIQNEEEENIQYDEQDAQKLHMEWEMGRDQQIEQQLVRGFKDGFRRRGQKRMYLADDAPDDIDNDYEETKRRRIALQNQRKNSLDSNSKNDDGDDEEYTNSPDSKRSNDMDVEKIDDHDDVEKIDDHDDDFENDRDTFKNKSFKNRDLLSFGFEREKQSEPLLGSQFKRQVLFSKQVSKNCSPQGSCEEDSGDEKMNDENEINQNKSRIFVGGKLLGERNKLNKHETVQKGCSQMDQIYGYQNFTSFVRKPADQNNNSKNEHESRQSLQQQQQYQQQNQNQQYRQQYIQKNSNQAGNSRKERYRSNIHNNASQSAPKLLDIVNKQNQKEKDMILSKQQQEKIPYLQSLLQKVNQGGRKP